jgi:hypothetical protein
LERYTSYFNSAEEAIVGNKTNLWLETPKFQEVFLSKTN